MARGGISPEPVTFTPGKWVRVVIYVPMAVGTYQAPSLIAPYGTTSVQVGVLINPAGGGGDPPWAAIDGTVRVTEVSGFGQPGDYGVAAGTVEATLRRPGDPDLQLSGQWGCVDASQLRSGG